MKNYYLILTIVSLFIAMSVGAQTTYTYNGNGHWTAQGNWSPSYPGTSIAAGDTVLLENQTVSSYGLGIRGTLIVGHGATFNVTEENGYSLFIVNGASASVIIRPGGTMNAHHTVIRTNSGSKMHVERTGTLNIYPNDPGHVSYIAGTNNGYININNNEIFNTYARVSLMAFTNHEYGYITNRGVLNKWSNSTLINNGNIHNHEKSLNEGYIINNRRFRNFAGATFENRASFENRPGGSVHNRGVFENGPSSFRIKNDGSFINQAGGNLFLNKYYVDFENNNIFYNNTSAHITGSNNFLNNGALVDNGSIASSVLLRNPGLIYGINQINNATIDGEFGGDGTISPGAGPSNSIGTYRIGPNLGSVLGIIKLEIRNTSNNDYLIIDDNVTQNLRVEVELINGFVPQVGDSFIIIGHQGYTGHTYGFDLPSLPSYLDWNIQLNSGHIALEVICGSSSVVCPPDITVNVDPNSCIATNVTLPEPTVTSCHPYTATSSAPINYQLGDNTVIWNITTFDNTFTCTQIVTVVDNTPPTASCKDITIHLDDFGNATITGSDIDDGSNDPCGIASLSVSPSTFDCSNIGANTVTLTVTDNNGNSSTCTAVVTVEDNIPPEANCAAPFTIQLDANGDAQIAVADIDNGSNDACGIASTSIDKSAFTCADVGPNTITLTVSDVNGNTSTCTTIVTVEDNVPPVARCTAPFTIQLDANGDASIAVGDIENGSTDACGIASLSVSPSSFTCTDVGPNTVTLTATDVNGNVSTCTTTVTVEDNVPPDAVCMDITIQLDATGNASIVAADIDGSSTDACGIASLSASQTDFDCSHVGPNNVTLTVADNNGNTSTCVAIVTVEDNVHPDAVCMDITIQLDATGNASIVAADIDGGSTDACGIASISASQTDFDCSHVGPNNVTLTVTDNHGNVSTCVAVVTVEDNVPPVIACPADVAVNTNPGQCYAIVTFPDAIAFDNCGIATIVQTMGDPSGSQFPVGVSTIEYTATDIHGNTSTCSFTITVTDNEPAMAVCMDITIQLDEFGDATITPADVDGGSTDNCGIASMSIDVDTFDCSDVGDNPVVLTVTDVNGNVSSCTAIVTVEDVTPPVAICMDITVQLDPTGTVTILGSDIGGASTDACGIASYDLDIDTFTCADVGDNPVVLTVTDVNGNVSTCTAIVTVEDNTAPDLVCMDITLELGADGNATIVPEDVIATNDDACGVLTTAVDIFEFDCSDIGTPVTVQVFSQDVNGNLSTCTAVVTIVDLLAPELTCPADQTVDPGAGNLFYEVPDYFAIGEATATDNCTDPVVITSQDPAAGTLLPDGTYTVTITAEDEYGNIATCTFELTVDTTLEIGDNVDISSIVLYPNPATDYVMLSNPNSVELKDVAIYDLTGRLIKTINLVGMGAEKAIDVSELASAPYLFIIQGETGQKTTQIIKE